MCCLPMVMNTDGIKLNGVAPSVCSVWCSVLAMIRLLRQSCAPPADTHPTTFVQDHLDELRQTCRVEIDRSTAQWHHLTYQDPGGSPERFAEPTAQRPSHPSRSPLDCKNVE